MVVIVRCCNAGGCPFRRPLCKPRNDLGGGEHAAKEDRNRFEKLERTRRLITTTDNVTLPENGCYYDELHDSIMSAIAATDIDDGGDKSSMLSSAGRIISKGLEKTR